MTEDVAVDVDRDLVVEVVALIVVVVVVVVLAVPVVTVWVSAVNVCVPVVSVVFVCVAVAVDKVNDVIDDCVVVLRTTSINSIGCTIVLGAAGFFKRINPMRATIANMSVITVTTRTRIEQRLGGFGNGSRFFASDPNERNTRRVGRFSSLGSCLSIRPN